MEKEKLRLKCKKWWNGRMCLQKFNFILRLPFDTDKRAPLTEKLATVKLCVSCPNRMFTLPKYAVDPKTVWKYEFLWRNQSVLSILLGDEEVDLPIDGKARILAGRLARTKKPSGLTMGILPTIPTELKNSEERAVQPVLTPAQNREQRTNGTWLGTPLIKLQEVKK